MPPGIYFIVNPYQASHGVVATLGGAVQWLGNINAAHPGLHPFYDAMSNVHIGNNQSLGITIFVAVFWFGHHHQYNAVLVGPFGKVSHQEAQIRVVKNTMDQVEVPLDWTQVILFGGK